jgi:tetratricopeptide (TPR) repeat protein
MTSGLTAVVLLVFMIIVLAVLVAFILLRSAKKGGSRSKPQKRKDRDTIIRDANKALSQDPKNPAALQSLAELYYDEQAWDKAMKTYGALIELCATHPDLPEGDISLRYGLAALQLSNYEEAYKSLAVAKSLEKDGFELNHNLGFLEYKKKNYEKAVSYLHKAYEQKNDHSQTQRYLGLSLFKIKKYKEAMMMLRRVLDVEPEDKQSLFVLGQCYYELGVTDQAVRIFTHLRPDPALGPHAALMSGTLHLNNHHYEKAQMDFEIGLRHAEIKPDISIELRYRLASAYVKSSHIDKALPHLQTIFDTNPDYKDVRTQLSRYREMIRDRNLQIFLMAPSSEFIGLCRRIVLNFFRQSRTKVTDISLQQNEYADLLAEVETSKWEDVILFRFIRSTGQIGELLVRDFHSRIKDMKAGRGICVSAGEFTEGAKQFVEARLIDLIDKEQLSSVLRKASD